MLLAVDLYEDFVDEERIAVPAMITLQSPSEFPAGLYAPEAYRFTAYRDSPLCQHVFNIPMVEIESEVQPNSVTNDAWRESVAFLSAHPAILSSSGS